MRLILYPQCVHPIRELLLQIDRIELGESFLGEPVNISLTGNAFLHVQIA